MDPRMAELLIRVEVDSRLRAAERRRLLGRLPAAPRRERVGLRWPGGALIALGRRLEGSGGDQPAARRTRSFAPGVGEPIPEPSTAK